jgi:hypothetical protein
VTLTREQVDALLQPIAGARVSQKQGMSHLEAYDVRRRIINLFGFTGWSGDVLSADLLYEQVSDDGKKVSVGYRVLYRLTLPDATYTEAACGDATNFPINKRGDAHDFAVKTAESQALKRCAVNLGDQFGISLYNNGSLAPLVRYVLGSDPAKLNVDGKVIRPEAGKGTDKPEPDHVTEPLAPETPASGGDEAPPADSPPTQDPPSLAAGDDLPIEDPPQVVLARKVDDIMAEAGASEDTPSAVKARLTKVLMEANKLKVRGEYVPTPDGEARTLEAYIQAAISEVGK